VLGPADVHVRAADPADEARVVECVIGAYQHYVALMGRQPAPMVADYPQLIHDGLVRVAVVNDEIVGVLVMWPEDDHLYVDNVAVLPTAQGLGVGRALLKVAEAVARETSQPEIRLYTNAAMITNLDYYPRRGFVETHRSDESGYQRVYFSKRLD
jgi:ribosomal protein S18 acetylase RimI-like enzyme